jgi:TetR/AcrR family transcriptional repressor of nem operon
MAGGRPKEFDTPEVLQRAMELFWRQGYAAASLPELLRAMGISRQSLYDTFGSKRDLYVGAIKHYRATQLSQALALLEREGSPVENVRSVVGFFEDLAADTRCRGCFVANALVEMGPHDAEIAMLLRETLETLRRGIERALYAAKASGELPRSKSPQRLSRALTNAMVGLAVTGKLELGRAELREIYAGTLSMLD